MNHTTRFIAAALLAVTASANAQQPQPSRPGQQKPQKQENGAALGLPNVRVPRHIAKQLCLDVDSALGLPPSTPLAKWVEISSAYGFLEDTAQVYGNMVLHKEAGGSNEMHDCQGLINTSGDRYTAFATLWVSDVLRSADFPSATVVAAVTLVGQPDTKHLGLKPNRNCVLLKGTDSKGNGAAWQAWMVPIGDADKCPTGNTMAGGTPLNVFRDSTGPKPTAGRWIDTGSTYYIGLQCGEYFCVIGVPQRGASPTGYQQGLGAGMDQQRLAKKSGGLLVPSRLMGTITALKDKITTDKWGPFRCCGMVQVASITIKGNDNQAMQQYKAKWGTTVTPGVPIALHLHHAGPDKTKGWKSKIGGGTPRDVKYLPADHSGPSTVRWRWSPDDEQTWRQCAEGCCGT
jgi:hypothetical protein